MRILVRARNPYSAFSNSSNCSSDDGVTFPCHAVGLIRILPGLFKRSPRVGLVEISVDKAGDPDMADGRMGFGVTIFDGIKVASGFGMACVAFGNDDVFGAGEAGFGMSPLNQAMILMAMKILACALDEQA